jgi:ComEC/Rec2-related protein
MHRAFINTFQASFFTLALICGILMQAYIPCIFAPPTVLIALYILSFCVYVLHAYLHNKQLTIYVTISLVLVLAGAFSYHQQQKNHGTFCDYVGNNSFDIIGTVTQILPMHQGHIRERLTIQINAIKLAPQKEWQPLNKSIHLQIGQTIDAQVADVIEVNKLTCKPLKKDSFSTYLIKEKIAASVFIQNPEWKLTHRPAFSFRRYLHALSLSLNKTLQQKLSRNAYSLFSSLFLGDTTTCKRQLEHTRDQFRAWGIMHYLARSGLHLIIFIAAWQSMLGVIPLPFLLKEILMLILSLIYFLLSCSSISFMRALYTFILYKICSIHKRPSHLIYLLSLVCFFVLLDNPMQLFFLDFQLSFTLTFALAWFNQIASYKKN